MLRNVGDSWFNENASFFKLLVERSYIAAKRKKKWLSGAFSAITSYKDFEKTNSVGQFSKEEWGEILQNELER